MQSFHRIVTQFPWHGGALALSCSLALGNSSHAADAPPPSNPSEPIALPDVVVTGRSDSLIGTAAAASEGVVGAEQLERRPILRPGELLETVPGLVISQHSGAGKANQYYLRGFNLDHGTDFATSIGGVPINMPTHGHGQGYTDLNFLIPELVSTVRFNKGPYDVKQGDFSSAGAADISYADRLPDYLLKLEGGSFGYGRGVFAGSPKVGKGTLLYGVEVMHDDGPWDHPDDFWKGNGVLRYSQNIDDQSFSLTAMGYRGDWDATDQIPLRAVEAGSLDRFGSLDTSTGGDSQRYSLTADWKRQGADRSTRVLVYGLYYDLDLYSNFTYFLGDPVNGDQFNQRDERWVAGAKANHQWESTLFGRPTEYNIGVETRNDFITNGLFGTAQRERLGTVREDDVIQNSLAAFAGNRTHWNDWLRSTVGVRADAYFFDVDSDNPANSGNADDAILSPRGGIVLGPWADTEFYLNGGLGFHSNDGRGSTTTIDPVTGDPVDPVDPLVPTYGAEVGARTTWVKGLQSTLTFWWLDIDSELLFIGDAGTTEASRPSRRYGVEFANYWSPLDWLTLDADFSLSEARFRDDDPAGDYIPGSIETVVSAGVSVHDLNGFFGELRLRYFGPRPLIEDNSVRSSSSTLLNGRIGYEFNERWSIAFEVFNLLDEDASDIDYYYASRMAGEPPGPDDGGYNDRHFHPAYPRTFRGVLTMKF